MEVQTLDGSKIITWQLISLDEWDKLTESQRSFVTYNGSFEPAKKIKVEQYEAK